jgi:hypothetical protein
LIKFGPFVLIDFKITVPVLSFNEPIRLNIKEVGIFFIFFYSIMVCPIADVPFSKVRELLDAVDAAKKSHDSGLAVDTLESLASQVRYV